MKQVVRHSVSQAYLQLRFHPRVIRGLIMPRPLRCSLSTQYGLLIGLYRGVFRNGLRYLYCTVFPRIAKAVVLSRNLYSGVLTGLGHIFSRVGVLWREILQVLALWSVLCCLGVLGGIRL